MNAKTIVCNAILPAGYRCGETAVIHNIHYQYDRISGVEDHAEQYVLKATIYNINCPHCGDRQQVELP